MAAGETLIVLLPLSLEDDGVAATASQAPPEMVGGIEPYPAVRFPSEDLWVAAWYTYLPETYDGGGLDVIIWCATDTATSGTCAWEARFARMGEDAVWASSPTWNSPMLGSATVPATQSAIFSITTVHPDGGQMDNTDAGEYFGFSLMHDTSVNTVTGGMRVLAIEIRETA